MKVPALNGRLRNVNLAKWHIDWNHKVSEPQLAVKRVLYPYWHGHVVSEEFRIPGSRMRVDLINWTVRVVIEISPEGSHSFNPFFHKSRTGFCAAMKRDLAKAEWAERSGFHYIELTDDDLANLSPEWFLEKHDLSL